MRSTFLCCLIVLLAREGSPDDSEFRPMSIPVHAWQSEARASTLNEVMRTDPPAPAVVAAIPAHYWEDALRHSVYLTLVRDKIDQLIVGGITHDTNPQLYASKDIDDHDLWDRIKSAPFDRIQAEEPPSHGDVTILAKGRLVEQSGEFRFNEDNTTKEKCRDDKCMSGVKAFWSVKRVRQRDSEVTPGKYHYELTFAVETQPKIQKNPYENPIRTFTVKESSPDQALDMPREKKHLERPPVMTVSANRPPRHVWVHKNIAAAFQPAVHTRHMKYGPSNLDRIFTSLFSDDDDYYEHPKNKPQNIRPPHWQEHQFSKVGSIGASSDQQKRLIPYPYKPHTYKFARPVQASYMVAPHQHVNPDLVSHGHSPVSHMGHGPPPKMVRPAVLPTPLPPITPPTSNWTETNREKPANFTENSTKNSELLTYQKPYSKPKPVPIKYSYISDHVRPPIYNAPPGVFATMDKKPFKPMPIMKFSIKPHKHKPADFRPSPQIIDMQHISVSNLQPDTVFRPIMWNYNDTFTTTTTEKIEVAESTQNDTTRKTPKGKKPPKKHENIRPTPEPEIITASSDSLEDGDLGWANVISAMTRTTPKAAPKKSDDSVTTTSTTTTTTTSTTTLPTTTAAKRRTTTTTEAEEPEPATTPKSKIKRTRPPPKFVKPDKFKKLKRQRTTTPKPLESKSTQDLTPQASSSSASKPQPSKPQTTSTTTTTTSTTTTTTTATPQPIPRPTKATTETSPSTYRSTSVLPDTPYTSPTTKPKTKSRYRQSTLMYKGTSVKHDKWSATQAPLTSEKSKVSLTDKSPPRRKGSNFHGYVSSTTPRTDPEYEGLHEDHGHSTPLSVKPLDKNLFEIVTGTYDDSDINEREYDELNSDDIVEIEQLATQDIKEFINRHPTKPSESANKVEHGNNITTEKSSITSASSTEDIYNTSTPTTENIDSVANSSTTSQVTSKPKCKKKQNQTKELNETSTPSLLDQLISTFTATEEEPTGAPSNIQEKKRDTQGQFVKLDDDISKFLDSLEGHHDEDESYDFNVQPLVKESRDVGDDEGDEDDDYEGDDEDNDDNDNESRYIEDIDDKFESGSPSLIELLAMD